MTQDPRTVYSELLARRKAEIAKRDAALVRLGYARLALAVAAAIIVWQALSSGLVSILWVLVPIAAFVALLVAHDRLSRALENRRRAERYFTQAMARLDGQWAGTGETGIAYLDAAHPYAHDLDLFGKGSLFELLSTARTHIGEDTLARWLLAPADPATVGRRQQAVEELRPRLDLREQLAVLAEEGRSGVKPAALAEWGEREAQLSSRAFRVALWVATVLGIPGGVAAAALVLHLLGLLPMSPPWETLARDLALFVLVVNGWFLYRNRGTVGRVAAAVEEAAHELSLLAAVLRLLEAARFRSPLLAELRASLDSEGSAPSARLARLARLMELLDSRDNIFVRLGELFVLWTPHLALRVEDWRRHSGQAVRRWLVAIGEMEALSSLSSHAFEHPADPFPEFVEDGPWLEAEAIGHPLLDERRLVRNDIAIGGPLRLLVVSGSNMSGKSTLLRTLGTNAVLAQAGAPVRARRLRLSALSVGASISISDSLQGGVSRFYAEILRLRQILDLTGKQPPVLFLIDELLNGTNSHDRRIGAAALVRELVARGAIGLVTTHDLALAEIADELRESAANVHFEDSIADGRIHFDYVMRPGIVRKSNAIELMRSVGLKI
ncbi:MAG: MutS-related protein [Bryobacteraceae bacterium]